MSHTFTTKVTSKGACAILTLGRDDPMHHHFTYSARLNHPVYTVKITKMTHTGTAYPNATLSTVFANGHIAGCGTRMRNASCTLHAGVPALASIVALAITHDAFPGAIFCVSGAITNISP